MEQRDENEPRSEDERNSADVNYEPEEELGDFALLRAKLEKIKTELEESKKEGREYLDGWQRCKADSVNAKREAAQYAERAILNTKEMFAEELIPLLDSFDAACSGLGWETLETQWKSGIEQIRNQFIGILSRHGVERYGRVGDMVDPMLYDIAEEIEGVPGEVGTIVKVLRFGYKIGDKVLRPAHVIVKSYPRGEPESA